MKKVVGKKRIRKEIKNEFVLNAPNVVTLARLILAFVFIYMLFANYSKLSLAIVFAVAAGSDALDGFLARKLGQTTSLGARLDQVIDRVFTMLIAIPIFIKLLLTMQTYWIVLLILSLSREIIGVWGLVIREVRDKDAYKVKIVGKVTTFLQAFALGVIIIEWDYAIYVVGLTCLVGILAGLDYLRDSLR